MRGSNKQQQRTAAVHLATDHVHTMTFIKNRFHRKTKYSCTPICTSVLTFDSHYSQAQFNLLKHVMMNYETHSIASTPTNTVPQ